MPDNNNTPPMASSIVGGPLKVWDQVFAERLDNIDLSVLLIYLVQVAPASALYYLAEQFDVLGYKGWLLANTDEERRSVIAGAIERKKYAGTSWAVTEALKSVGYADAKVLEGVNATYDGTFNYDGTITYGSNFWALFSIDNLDLGETKGFNENDLIAIKKLIDEWKRGVCHLVNINFSANVSDELLMRGIVSFQIIDTNDQVLEEYTGENLIVNSGRSGLARLISGDSSNREVDRIGFGTNGTDPDSGDTSLTDAFEKSIDGVSYPDPQSVKFDFELGYTEANGKNIQEFGLLCANNDLFSRKTRSVIVKTDDFKIVGSWTIIFE